MSAELKARDKAAREIITRAGELAMKYFKSVSDLTIESKGLQDRVTIADREVERLIAESLARQFPDDGFLGEETGLAGNPGEDSFTWVVDPIDGTDCFVYQMPSWSVSIGLMRGTTPVAGYICNPPCGELWHGFKGGGAYLNGSSIATSKATKITDGIVGIGFSHRRDPALTLEALKRLCALGGVFQRNGSAALTMAYVASGRYLGFMEAHINAWDILAGLVLVEEAGGYCNDFFDGKGLLEGNAILASAAGVKDTMIEITDPVF